MSNESLPTTDDVQNSDPTEQELLDAVLANSPIMDEVVEVPLPTEEIESEDPVEAVEEEDPETEEAVSEEVEEEVEETEEDTVGEDDTSTQPDVYTADDLDLDAKVSIKVDGKEMDVSFGDLIKGYSTEQSLSNKGRELGEARKAIEEERNEKLSQLDSLMNGASSVMMQTEQAHAKVYHDIEAKIKKAREEGDTFELGELKDQRELAQQQYWEARKTREGLIQQAAQQYQEVQSQQFQQQVEHFAEVIPTLIPDFNEEVAGSIRSFAIEEGITPEILDNITDPMIVKFVDDYRRLKQTVSKGTAKRKAAPTKKVPAKKAAPAKKKAEDKAKMVKARAFREDASKEDQMDFLRQYASNSLNNL